MTSSGSVENSGSTGRLVWETSSLMPTVKWFFGAGCGEIVKDRLDHGGREFLGGQAVAAAHDQRQTRRRGAGVAAMFEQGRHAILVERFAGRARFLGAVEHGDGFDRGGQGLRQTGALSNGR